MTKQILIKNLKTILKHVKQMKKLEDLIKKDTRGLLFLVEGILRLYSKYATLNSHDEGKITQAFNFIKKIEDEMGQTFFYKEMNEYYSNTFNKKLDNLEQDKNKKFEELFTFFKNSSFEQEMTKIILDLESLEFQKDSFIVKSIAKEVKRIDIKINEKLSLLINKPKYGFHEMEEGVHEWRRMIRWVALYIQGHSYLFSLKLKKKHVNHPIVKKYKNSKFCILSESGKYKINAKAYYTLSDFIVKVGDLKTKAEVAYFLNKNYKVNLSVPSIEKESQVLLYKFKQSKVLKKLMK